MQRVKSQESKAQDERTFPARKSCRQLLVISLQHDHVFLATDDSRPATSHLH
jgi:hypothetical protein